MAIYKCVNGSNNTPDYLEKAIRYITSPHKTENGSLIGSYGCFKDKAYKNMYAVKKMFFQTHGKQGEHSVLSVSNDISDKKLLKLAYEICKLRPEYQTVFAVHKDTNHPHIHFIMNTVSISTGLKFNQGPPQLKAYKEKLNNTLFNYGLDIIRSKPIVDTSDYTDEDFKFFEFSPVDFGNEIIKEEIEENYENNNYDDEDNYYNYNNGGICLMNNIYPSNHMYGYNNCTPAHYCNSSYNTPKSVNTQNKVSEYNHTEIIDTPSEIAQPSITINAGHTNIIETENPTSIESAEFLKALGVAEFNETELTKRVLAVKEIINTVPFSEINVNIQTETILRKPEPMRAFIHINEEDNNN